MRQNKHHEMARCDRSVATAMTSMIMGYGNQYRDAQGGIIVLRPLLRRGRGSHRVKDVPSNQPYQYSMLRSSCVSELLFNSSWVRCLMNLVTIGNATIT